MLYIGKHEYEEMVEHLKGVYPYEGCGLMLGKGDRVTKVRSVENRRKERANDRYEIDGRDILRIEKRRQVRGWMLSVSSIPTPITRTGRQSSTGRGRGPSTGTSSYL